MPVIAAETLREGLLSDYRDVYRTTGEDREITNVGLVMDMNAFTDGRTNTRGYFEAAPHPKYQPQGDPIHEEGMTSRSFTIQNYPYSLRVGWHKDDREDDRTGSLNDMARAGGKNHRLLPVRAFFDLITDTASLLPAVPNAADGANMFITSTRFGVSTGNSITVSSWSASGPAARGAFWSAYEQMGLFQDGKGQPLHGASVLDSPVLVVHAMADLDIVAEALLMGTVAYANSTSNAGVDNPLQALGKKWIPWPTQRLATGTMYLFWTGAPVKPLLQQVRTPIVESYADETNDPDARNTGNEYVQWRQRLGYGIGLPYAAIKVTAS